MSILFFAQFGITLEYEMQPLADIYLLSKTKGENGGGDMSYIYIFLTVGIFILVLASINYMNLATSRAEKTCKGGRNKESVGLLSIISDCTIYCRINSDHLCFIDIGNPDHWPSVNDAL